MSEVKIRRAIIEDAEFLAAFSYQTFHDAFHDHPKNAPDDLKAYMDSAFCVETVSTELSEKDSIFLIAEVENETVGYAKVIFGSIEDGISAEKPIELNRLYAKSDFIGKGIGQILMDECFDIAAQNECDVMWLGVWEYNPRAKRFYEKQGFSEVGAHVFQLGSDPQIDILMQKRLQSC